jgi:D-glycero-alpha-D-manno-heptose 1-phosphate guanylyltransferase
MRPYAAKDLPLADVTAAILAGGLGTRLRSAVADRPKVLAEVDGRPFLAYQLDQLADAGVRRVVICTGYLGAMVEHAFGSRYRNLSLCYSQEAEPLGTGGALRAALEKIPSDALLALNGDSLCHADLKRLAIVHFAQRAAGTLLLAHVDDASRYGRVELDEQGSISAFAEKQSGAAAGWINAGIYLFERAMIESISPEHSVSLEREVLPAWIGRGLCGHRGDGPFLDIGTPESYQQARAFVQRLAAA